MIKFKSVFLGLALRVGAISLASFAIALFVAVVAQEKPKAANSDHVITQMHNVIYHFADDIYVHLIDVGGELVPTSEGGVPVFDDKQSFTLRIAAAEMAIDTQSLANILNHHVFAGNDAPLKSIAVRIEKGRLRITGKLHKKGDIAFEMEGDLSATNDGNIRLHAEKLKALHLPVKGFMDLFGVDIADLIKTGKVRGVRAEKDDLILDPTQILPPPRIEGRLTQVRVQDNEILETFGDPKTYAWSRVPARNYIAYRGGRLQFGKLMMEDTDMILFDSDPKDPFDFYLDHYKEQLSAGYTKITPSFGLRVYMVDFNKLNRRTR